MRRLRTEVVQAFLPLFQGREAALLYGRCSRRFYQNSGVSELAAGVGGSRSRARPGRSPRDLFPPPQRGARANSSHNSGREQENIFLSWRLRCPGRGRIMPRTLSSAPDQEIAGMSRPLQPPTPDRSTPKEGDARGVPPSTAPPSGERATIPEGRVSRAAPLEGLDRYEVLGELSHGGMGVVYRARDTVLGRVVALKMIRTGEDTRAEETIRFHREAEAVSQLDHPNVIRLYDFGVANGLPYFTMPLAEGGSL